MEALGFKQTKTVPCCSSSSFIDTMFFFYFTIDTQRVIQTSVRLVLSLEHLLKLSIRRHELLLQGGSRASPHTVSPICTERSRNHKLHIHSTGTHMTGIPCDWVKTPKCETDKCPFFVNVLIPAALIPALGAVCCLSSGACAHLNSRLLSVMRSIPHNRSTNQQLRSFLEGCGFISWTNQHSLLPPPFFLLHQLICPVTGI